MCMRRSTARGNGPDDVRLCHADLLHGAKLQLRGALRMKVRLAPQPPLLPMTITRPSAQITGHSEETIAMTASAPNDYHQAVSAHSWSR